MQEYNLTHLTGVLVGGAPLNADTFQKLLESLGLDAFVTSRFLPNHPGTLFALTAEAADKYAPDSGTLLLSKNFQLDSSDNEDDLEREILLALLLAPILFTYADFNQLASQVRIRMNIVKAARNTVAAFDTSDAAERPADYWTYSKENGFTILSGKSLIEALRKAIQPGVSRHVFAFSCYRATEYVILLGMAEEAATYNPNLYEGLQRQWERRAIMSGEFHEAFLIEYGSIAEPLPPGYYVPGDRLWFRNPDGCSSDVSGYEGSWVFYLGGGLFTNFWKCGETYTLPHKCLEIYHWRNGVYRDKSGHLQMDESKVEAHVRESRKNPEEEDSILKLMMRFRDPQGIYADGGCIDVSREYPRFVCRNAPELPLPEAA